MRVQESHDSMHTIDSPTSAVVEQGDSPRTRAYKAKDEKRDLASERASPFSSSSSSSSSTSSCFSASVPALTLPSSP